ncbi:leucine-rich repeat-containing protein 34 [Drosophila nasuta]|uniref:leucine-rich repeat-containing protein 34 n=1 Tax=Drosophila nasuta TaxID=42062 RepID=UPI00295E348E|nr:leucine-rich repeat-containing protein 34 [Drosophila nasuta]
MLPCKYAPNSNVEESIIKGRLLSTLLLECWQREYDKRPYTNFRFRRLDFEERLKRRYHCLGDFRVIVKFLFKYELSSVSIWSIFISKADPHLLRDFVHTLLHVPRIELKLMHLPEEFFVMLRLNANKMKVGTLSLEGTPLTDEKAKQLREFLLASKTLHTLNVCSCSLSLYNFATVADGVHKSSKMRNFYVSRLLALNLSLDSEKIASTVGSLLMQNKLVELTMEQCEFLALDMEIFAEYLENKHCSLRKLKLAYNLISADGALFLMRAIAKGGTLELLDISTNSIGSHGGEWVAQYFSSCNMLQHLYLNDNRIGAEAINLLLLTIKKPCRIRRLQIYGNQFNSRSAMILRRLLDAQVIMQEEIDISYTYDEALEDYRIVPWR